MPPLPPLRPSLSRGASFAGAAFALLAFFASAQLLPAQARTPADPPRGDLRIVVFGDFNGPYGSLSYPEPVERTLGAITKVWRPDLLLSPGDVIAGQNRSLPDERFAQMWRAFDELVAGPLRGAAIPYAVALGNHDASSQTNRSGAYLFARERAAAHDYWSRPMYDSNLAYIDRSRHPYDYAFRIDDAVILVVDASSARLDQEQLDWLERTLAGPEALAAGLRVVVGHLPLMPVGLGRDSAGEYLADSARVREILEAAQVDLYISGHHAAYYPGRLGNLELLFAGGVGARRLLVGDSPARSTVTVVDFWRHPLEIRYTTFDIATMQVIPTASLPSAIPHEEEVAFLSSRATGTDATGQVETEALR